MALAVFALSGCNGFLDTTPKDRVSDKLVWTSTEYADLYVNHFYQYLSIYGQFGSAQFNGNMTEGLTNTFKYGSTSPGSKAGDSNDYVFYVNKYSSSGSLLDIWSSTYERIRRVNEFLDLQKTMSTFPDEVNTQYEAQARFFRAFLYFQLAKRHTQGKSYGGLILYTDLNMKKNTALSSAEDVWQQIYDDLDFAAKNLPAKWDAANSGRITKYGAYAFLSRAMLYAERWDDAKDAADKVINEGGYSLTKEYKDSYKGGNTESIIQFAYNAVSGPNHSFDKDYVPYGDYALAGSTEYGGKGCPTQEMVEYYEMADGTAAPWSDWKATGTLPPYEKLEPRFHASVIYPGSTWKGRAIMPTEDGKNGRFMEFRADQYANGRTVTGYYLRKLLDENHVTDLVSVAGAHTWVEMRLAEVYLIRAEALHHLEQDELAKDDINVVRARVNLPETTNSDVMAAIRQERLVELSYEGHLYWDMRRWKLAHIEYNNYRCHGIKVKAAGADYTCQYVDCDLQDRFFNEKTYIFPIPTTETDNNSAVEQFKEWK